MRLAILHPFQYRYSRGIERYLWTLAQALCRLNPDLNIDLLTWRWADPVHWENPAGSRIRALCVPDLRYYRAQVAAVYYSYWMTRNHYDHAMAFFAGYGEADAFRLLGRRFPPYSVVFHYPVEQVPHRYAEFKRYGFADHAAHLIGVSDYTSRGVTEYFGKPCVTIENGVDTDYFHKTAGMREAARQQLGVDATQPVLVSLAALEERKGIQHVIKALPTLRAKFPDIRYYVVGEGDYRPTLETLIESLGLQANVLLTGRKDDVRPYLAAADVGCLVSEGEAFPLTLLEYMAMELPVVTSDLPPFPDLVSAAWGVQANPQAENAVSDAIADLLSDPQRRQNFGEAGRKHLLEHNTWTQIAGEYLDVIGMPAHP